MRRCGRQQCGGHDATTSAALLYECSTIRARRRSSLSAAHTVLGRRHHRSDRICGCGPLHQPTAPGARPWQNPCVPRVAELSRRDWRPPRRSGALISSCVAHHVGRGARRRCRVVAAARASDDPAALSPGLSPSSHISAAARRRGPNAPIVGQMGSLVTSRINTRRASVMPARWMAPLSMVLIRSALIGVSGPHSARSKSTREIKSAERASGRC